VSPDLHSSATVALWLRLVALAEPATLAVLLTNVTVLHEPGVAAAIGPVHGGCYLAIIIGFLIRDHTTAAARLLAVLPGIGGLLTLRQVRIDATAEPAHPR